LISRFTNKVVNHLFQAAAALASSGNHDPEKDAEFDALLSTKKAKTPKRPRKASAASDDTPSVAKKPKTKAAEKKSNVNLEVSPANSPVPSLSVSNHASTSKKSASSTAVSSFLDRPTAERPVSPSFDITTSSKILADKDIQPSNLSFGFLGLGIMGSGIVKNLINSGNNH
jgi:hypothetical protein